MVAEQDGGSAGLNCVWGREVGREVEVGLYSMSIGFDFGNVRGCTIRLLRLRLFDERVENIHCGRKGQDGRYITR